MAEAGPGAFWAFSLEFYRRQGASAAFLALQDEHGADVDEVLFALWCARRGHVLRRAELEAADASIARLREDVVRTIREARRALKPPPNGIDPADADALRKDLLKAELEAERLQHGVMERTAPADGTTDPAVAARANLALLAAFAGIPDDAPALAALLQAFA